MCLKQARTLLLLLLATTITVNAQTRIPSEYRGSDENIARGVLGGNNIETNFRNHGEMARWSDIPWGRWYTNRCDPFDENCTFQQGTYIDGIGFTVAARVLGERAKWGVYYGESVSDTMLNPVIINYRDSGRRISPYSGNLWGWLPLNGFHNRERKDPVSFSTSPIPAISSDNTSWPESWPDRLNETTDAGWANSWNGFRGKGLITGDQETFYVMDDFSDKEYTVSEEIEGPHSLLGVYYPSPTDSSIGGLGLQTEVRTFQFNNTLAKDALFTQYRTTNVSEKNLPETWTSIILDASLIEVESGGLSYNEELDAFIFKDLSGNSFGQGSNGKASFAIIILEHSLNENNGIDEDQDGITDESKFNDPGQLIIGKEEIDAFLEANYNMELFLQNYIALENLPSYKNERWWTGDEDLDWIAYDDVNRNGQQDEDEPIVDDIGRDGLGPNDVSYPGPDEGERDGIPTQGEPNFGEQDMLEAENRGLGNFDLNTRPFFESGDNLRDDTWLFGRINNGSFENDKLINPVTEDEPFLLVGTGSFNLPIGESSYFTTALVFAESYDSLVVKIPGVRAIYESDYDQSQLTTIPTSNEEALEAPSQFSLSQNYPNPFNPTTNIEFSLSKTAPVSLTIFDIPGREVRVLISDKTYSSGVHTVQLNASNLASGIYIYRLEVAGEVFTRKLTLIK